MVLGIAGTYGKNDSVDVVYRSRRPEPGRREAPLRAAAGLTLPVGVATRAQHRRHTGVTAPEGLHTSAAFSLV